MDLTVAYRTGDHIKFKEEPISDLSEKMNELDETNNPDESIGQEDDCGDTIMQTVEKPSEELVQGLQWEDGIGTLPGSDMKFHMNEFGVVELIMDDESTGNSKTQTDSDDPDFDPSVVEIKDQNCKSIKSEAQLDVKSSDTNEDTSVSKINSLQSSDGPLVQPQAQCAICGFSGDRKNFLGKFCSRKCLAKNASSYRRANQNAKKQLELAKQENRQLSRDRSKIKDGDFTAPVKKENESNRKSNDLKMRIRFSSSSPPAIENESTLSTRKRSRSSIDHAQIISPSIQSGRPRKRKFVWSQYLARENSVAVSEEQFQNITGKNPFPGENKFECGMALEGVDPRHQSLFCPMTVAAVQGYRIRLNFCGYSSSYDFWVNADSPLIFPCGFCEETGRLLEPPHGYSPQNFAWKSYMKRNKLYPAPHELFYDNYKENKFKVGERLEAVDKHNPDLVCVATVSDVVADLVLVHFDGWTRDYDYWCSISSYLIHPVGWCGKEGKELTPPEGFKELIFSWPKYLEEYGVTKASESSFYKRSEHKFLADMKLEVVDVRNPVMIRVATIAEVSGARLRIHFDGWSDIYDFWTDVESPDIHPIGWCDKTNHKLQPPVDLDEMYNANAMKSGGCPIPGCIGVGHIKGAKFVGHHSEYGCPYSPQNLQKDYLDDRLTRSKQNSATNDYFDQSMEDISEDFHKPGKIRRTISRKSFTSSGYEEQENIHKPNQGKSSISSNELDTIVDENGKSQYSSLHYSVFLSTLSSFPNYDFSLCWDQQAKILSDMKGKSLKEVSKWSCADVGKFVSDLTGFDHSDVFKSEEIDGEALLLLTQLDITKVLKIKLGPAVKIYNAILLLKAAEHLPV